MARLCRIAIVFVVSGLLCVPCKSDEPQRQLSRNDFHCAIHQITFAIYDVDGNWFFQGTGFVRRKSIVDETIFWSKVADKVILSVANNPTRIDSDTVTKLLNRLKAEIARQDPTMAGKIHVVVRVVQ